MEVDLRTVGRLCVGCVEARRRDGALEFHRLSPSLEALYQERPAQLVRMQCPSAVRIRFASDTRRVRVGVRYGAEARPIYRGALCVDAEPQPWGPATRTDEWEGTIFATAEPALRVFDLWLPHQCVALLTRLELSDGAAIRPAPALRRRWIAYGDSITQGMTASSPTATHVGRCALELEAEVLNLGIGGATLEAELAACVPDWPCDFLTIAYGANDFNQSVPLGAWRARAHSLLAAVEHAHPGRPVFLITPLTWAGCRSVNSAGARLPDYRAALADVARRHPRTRLIPGETMIPDNPAYFVDLVHPNDRGFAEYARGLLTHLRGN